ncbi:MAG TPA: GntR family transcriptional regulator [Solirubrobacteraceae bacterium]|jgi:GntR family transcriptional regulator
MADRRLGGAAGDLLPARLKARSPKGQELREILETLIASLGPGAPLPSERALAERYGVARMTVRSMLDRLTSEGLTYRVHGRGTFVAEPRVAQAMSLSSFSEDMLARGLRPGSTVLRQEVMPAGGVVAARLQISPRARVVRIDRVRTADGEPLALEQAFLPAARFKGLEGADLATGSLFTLLETRWGVRLAAADQRVVAVTIDGEEAELLDVAPGEAGLRFSTLAEDAGGDVVFFATSLFRGDRYEIDLRQRRE